MDVRLGTVEELRAGSGWMVVQEAAGLVGVYRENGRLHAFRNRCPHQGGPVCQGQVLPAVEAQVAPDGSVTDRFRTDRPHIVCPWHGWEFELPSGRCAADSRYGLQRLEVVERAGQLYAVVPDQDSDFAFAGG